MANKVKTKKVKRPHPRTQPSIYGKVIGALNNDRYKYRTLRGIAKEAGVPEEKILKVVREHSDEIVILFRTTKDGQPLFASRKKYQKKATAMEKVMGAFLNRVY